MQSASSSYRPLHEGMGQAVAERTYLRAILTDDAKSALDPVITLNPADPDFQAWMVALHNTDGFTHAIDDSAPFRGMKPPTRWETWGELAERVAVGNASLLRLRPGDNTEEAERDMLNGLIAKGAVLMSGRHLQQGDANQLQRPMEVFTNCSTACSSFALFYLLLNGSGVGRSYDDDLMLVNWDHMPTLRVVLDESHKDFNHSQHVSVRDARHLYGKGGSVHWFEVPDSREGWAEAVELLETMAFERSYRDDLLVLDFSKVRARGEPIMGMQGRPSSGPVPLMNAFEKIAKIKGAGLKPWLQALYIDHFLAEPVLVGGARRAARMSTKHWTDIDIMDFIEVKRPIEYENMTMDEVIEFRSASPFPPMAFLWSSNNSVTVDEDFWRRVELTADHPDYQTPQSVKARQVLQRVAECSYGDGTGEPGIINEHKLTKNNNGLDADAFRRGDFVGSDRYQVKDETRLYLTRLAKVARRKKNAYITNPCGEIVLHVMGGFCVIADVVPFHCDTLHEAEEAVRAATRALMRVNLMDSLYREEVQRTNRIGVGLTGVHEFAWKFFNIGFRDLINPDFGGYQRACPTPGEENSLWLVAKNMDAGIRSACFWAFLGHLSRSVKQEATYYAQVLGVEVPHTMTTIKPSGTVSKLFGLTEGWHLPAMEFFMRWVQYRADDPLLDEYASRGYPVRTLEKYRGHSIVGFPTAPTIATLGMGDALVTAGKATMEEQYRWLQLGEMFWLEGGDIFSLGIPEVEQAHIPYGNQISYTMKYRPDDTGFDAFVQAMTGHQSSVRCVSVMPQGDLSAYEYLPEQPVSKAEFEDFARAIQRTHEDVGREHVDCASGACPIEWVDGQKAA